MVTRTPGPFDYYQDIHGGVNGDTIRADATSPSKNSADLHALATELEGDDKKVTSQIEGDIKKIAKNPKKAAKSSSDLAVTGFYAVALMRKFATMVDTFDKKANHCNWEYRTQLASAMRWQGKAAAQTKTKTDDAKVDEKHMGPAVKANIAPEYKKALKKLDHDADSIAAKFKEGPTPDNVRKLIRAGLFPLSVAAAVDGLKLSKADRNAYYKHALKNMSPAEQKAWIKANLGHLDPEAAKYVDPSVQQYFAAQVAKDIKNPDDIDSDTVNLLQMFKGQHAFAHELYSNVTPDQMADAIKHLNDAAYPTPSGVVPGSSSDTKDQQELYRNFLNAAGMAFATYTKGTGAYTPPSNLADKWFKAITDDDNKENASALTLLIRAGGHQTKFDPDFIRDVTGKVYEWEIHQDGAVWGPRDVGIMDPNADPHLQSKMSGKDYYTSEYTSGFATDGLANLLGGMEHNPQAAKDFFMGNYAGSSQDLDQRMDYLVGGGDQRTWDGADMSDDGDGLGLALQAATVGEEHRTADGTSIASKLFQNIAKYGGEGDGTFDNKWHVGPKMTDSLGTIAAGYTGDLYDLLDGTGVSDGPTHLDLGEHPGDTLKQVLGEIGRGDDKSGLETVTSAMLLRCKAEVGDQVAGLKGPHTIDNLLGAGLDGQQERNGRVMGMLLKDGLYLSADQDHVEQQRAALMSKALDVTAGFIPGLGDGASEVSKMAFDTLKGQAIDALKGQIQAAPSTDAYLDSTVMPIDKKLQYSAIDSLVQHGYLGPQDTKFGHYDGVPSGILVGDPPNQHIDPRLYDQNGADIDTSGMSTEERHKVEAEQEAWRDFNQDPRSDQILGLTQQSTFMKYFTDPTP